MDQVDSNTHPEVVCDDQDVLVAGNQAPPAADVPGSGSAPPHAAGQRPQALAPLQQSWPAQACTAQPCDLSAAACKLRNGAAPQRLRYIEHLAASAPQSNLTLGEEGRRLPANARPSVLQLKQLQGGHGLASVLHQVPAVDGLSLPAFETGPKGQLQLAEGPPGGVAQFSFELVKAVHVGPTGFGRQRPLLRSCARVAIFDRQHHRFLGNVHEMPAAEVRANGGAWAWHPGAGGSAIVRCSRIQPDPSAGARAVNPERLVLLVELCVAFRLAAEDAAVLPPDDSRASRMVDELSTCWAMISFGCCADLAREMEITVPLYIGSPFDPVLLSKLFEEERRQQGPLLNLLSRPKQPSLTFRAAPLVAFGGASGGGAAAAAAAAMVAPLWALPPTVIAGADAACALAVWRMATAAAAPPQQPPRLSAQNPAQHRRQSQEQQQRMAAAAAQQQQHALEGAVVGDAALAAFPEICGDPTLWGLFMEHWAAECRDLRAQSKGSECLLGCEARGGPQQPSPAALCAALRRSALAVSPLLRCASLPPRHIANFAEWSARREAVASAYCYRKAEARGCVRGFGGSGGGGGGAGGKRGGGRGGDARKPRPAVEVLSLMAGNEFLHRPFDVSEVRLEVGAPPVSWLAV